MPKPRRVATGPGVVATYERMVDIGVAIIETQHPDPQVEYSALMGVAAGVLASSLGIRPTNENLSILTGIIAGEVMPAVEDAAKRRFPNN
jgi:hypothetical protein